jgi:hypothetical protein
MYCLWRFITTTSVRHAVYCCCTPQPHVRYIARDLPPSTSGKDCFTSTFECGNWCMVVCVSVRTCRVVSCRVHITSEYFVQAIKSWTMREVRYVACMNRRDMLTKYDRKARGESLRAIPRRRWRVRILLNWISLPAVWWYRVGSDDSEYGSVWPLWTRQLKWLINAGKSLTWPSCSWTKRT